MARNRLRRDLFPLEPLQLVFDESCGILRQLNRCGHEIDLRIFVMLRFAEQISCDMRRCLGESFAELEGLLIMATLTSKVPLRLVNEQTTLPNPLFTLRQNIPVHMTIESVGTPELYPTTV